jgi:hypothetical protein
VREVLSTAVSKLGCESSVEWVRDLAEISQSTIDKMKDFKGV